MNPDTLHIDTDLRTVLTSFEITDYETQTTNSDKENTIELTVEPQHTPALNELLHQRETYLQHAHDNPTHEDVVEHVVTELQTAFNIEFNRTDRNHLADTYQRDKDQWNPTDTVPNYNDYNDLLHTVTEGMNPETLSIPTLFDDVLEAIATSETHELPSSPVAVKELISAHITERREMESNRKGQHELKRRLEQRGIDPRTAAHIASDMDDLLISDSELTEKTK